MLCAKAGRQLLECSQVLDHDDLLGEMAWLEGPQELVEDDLQAQLCERIVLLDLLPEGTRDAVLEAVETSRRGESCAWVIGMAG